MTQVSPFLFSREELRQIRRWFLLAWFLFRGVVLYEQYCAQDRVLKLKKMRFKKTHFPPKQSINIPNFPPKQSINIPFN